MYNRDCLKSQPQQKDIMEGDPVERRPALISIRFLKESADQRLGLGFLSTNGELVFSTITPTSPLVESSIRVGDRLLSIDHHQTVTHWKTEEAASYLRSRTDGFISMIIDTKNGRDSNIVEACVSKSTAGLKLGLTLYNDKGRLRIRRVTGRGLLGAFSVLEDGDFVESINGTEAQNMDATTAHDVLNNAVGLVSIRTKKSDTTRISLRDVMMSAQLSSRRYSEHVIAADELDIMESGNFLVEDDVGDLPRPRFISVTAQKPTVDTKMGISFANPTGNKLILLNIAPQGLLGKSPLKAGCILHSINGISTQRYSKSEVTDLVRTLSGAIEILAEDPMGVTSHAVAMIFKPTPRAKVYLSFRSSTEGGRNLVLSRIGSESLFNNSVLNVDDKIIAINKIPCEHVQPSEAVEFTQRNPESVTILVRIGPKNGIVLSHGKAVPGISSSHISPGNQTNDEARTERMSCEICGMFFVVLCIFMSHYLFMSL